MLLYSSVLLAVLVVGAPYWLARMLTSGRYRAGLSGRLGRVPQGLRKSFDELRQTGRDVVWLHAVSVGEVLAATRLVDELQAGMPGVVIAVSTTTETGQELARQRFAGSPVFYLPLDFGFLMRRTLRLLQPRLVVLMESELWPNMIRECRNADVPMAVVNARVSDRSFPRYLRLRALWRPLLQEVTLYLAQSEETAERLRAMGVPVGQVRMAGNLKYDVRVAAASAMTRRVRGWVEGRGVELVVAGSTLAGEEEALLERWLDVQRSAAPMMTMLLIAPRHKDRFDEVFALIQTKGYVPVRCSRLPEFGEETLLSGNVVLLLDTIGDLASMYSLATVAFVGGSLVPKCGHNPLEPAQFGVPVVMGESYENFREMVETMRKRDAIRIVSAEGLGAELAELLKRPDEARALGERGRTFFEAQAGATERVVAELMGLLR